MEGGNGRGFGADRGVPKAEAGRVGSSKQSEGQAGEGGGGVFASISECLDTKSGGKTAAKHKKKIFFLDILTSESKKNNVIFEHFSD